MFLGLHFQSVRHLRKLDGPISRAFFDSGGLSVTLWPTYPLVTSEDKVWTIVNHNLPVQSAVVSNKPEKHASLALNYNTTMDQISAITSSAEYCEQFVAYFCKLSRLLNTPGPNADPGELIGAPYDPEALLSSD
ncbi:UNVERIFIED_CONTAM: hypothetical protein K2H54_053077 [Gekko kuhli]